MANYGVNSPWTPDKVKQLVELWEEGWPAAAIADYLGGFSRCAVIGKAHRLGLPRHRSARPASDYRAPQVRVRRKPVLRVVAPVQPSPPVVPEEEPHQRRMQVVDLTDSNCHWPYGDPRQEDFHFCGEPAAAGRPYCAKHWAKSRVPQRRAG